MSRQTQGAYSAEPVDQQRLHSGEVADPLDRIASGFPTNIIFEGIKKLKILLDAWLESEQDQGLRSRKVQDQWTVEGSKIVWVNLENIDFTNCSEGILLQKVEDGCSLGIRLADNG